MLLIVLRCFVECYKITQWYYSYAIFLLALSCVATTSAATNRDGVVLQSYSADYFNQYAPLTALDMVKRVPGFQIQTGNSKRGLGQGGANVLLNGLRLTGKGAQALDQLDRVTASNVVRVEILDGDSLRITGLSGDVANIVTHSHTKQSGIWEWSPEWRNRLKANWLPFKVTISGERGDVSYTAEIENSSVRRGSRGLEDRRLADGTLYETVYEDTQNYVDNPGGVINLSWRPKKDHIGNLNFEYYQYNANDATKSFFTAQNSDGFDGFGLFTQAEDEWNAKIDGDYEFPFWQGRLKLIGYYRVEDSPTVSRYDLYDRSSLLTQTRYYRDADEGEAIARAEYGYSLSNGSNIQLSLEGVYNFLDIESRFEDQLNVRNTQIFDDVRVEENRIETSITKTRALSPKWDAQLSLAGEYSEITQGALKREFLRPKGFISATFKPVPMLNIRSKIERDVGQLNFFNFIASVDLQDNLGRAANANLVPNQSWLAEIEFDRQFEGGHNFKTRFYGAAITDLVDRIPVGINGDAVGNIEGKAYQYGIDIFATIKGEPLDLEGMQLDTRLELRDSSVDDPVQGFSRRLNGDNKSYWSLALRHDIVGTDWAYGFNIEQYMRAPVYRLTVIDEDNFIGPWGVLFIEHKNILGMKIRTTVRNLFDASYDFKRIRFTDRRDIGAIESTEEYSRALDLYLGLNVSGTF